METKDYLKDLSEIRSMMTRSTQFISLSGLSGVMAGAYALAGAYVAKRILAARTEKVVTLQSATFLNITLTALAVLALALSTVLLLTHFKAVKNGEKIWNSTSKRLLTNFLIPLLTGTIFGLLLLLDQVYELLVPVSLIFYGLSCVNASKYTFRDVRYLGLCIILLGLISTEYSGYAVEFWALGFGVCHIIYGLIMYFKYDKK